MANPLDPTNPVNTLVIRGMQAEGQGRHDRARDLFAQAWDAHTTAIEGAVAAHYVARQQDSPEQTLEWNRRALDLVADADADTVAGWMPSLHLNLGKSYEDLGDLDTALRHYRRAEAASPALSADGYGSMTRAGIANAIARLTGSAPGPPTSAPSS